MKYLKIFEDFEKSKVSIDDIIQCIESGGEIYTDIIKDLPDNDPNKPLKPVSVDETGAITVEINGEYYEVDLDKVKRLKY